MNEQWCSLILCHRRTFFRKFCADKFKQEKILFKNDNSYYDHPSQKLKCDFNFALSTPFKVILKPEVWLQASFKLILLPLCKRDTALHRVRRHTPTTIIWLSLSLSVPINHLWTISRVLKSVCQHCWNVFSIRPH